MSLLVVYASRHGATAGIAARIATRLRDSGAAVDLRSVEEVETLDRYDAVVLGAPVYDQSWPPEANAFVSRNRDALAARPLWLFSVGAFGDTKRWIGPMTHKEPKGIGEIRADVGAREYRVFRGVIQKHQWPFWSRVFFHAFGGRFGDHRDWPTIDSWADRIAEGLPGQRSTSLVRLPEDDRLDGRHECALHLPASGTLDSASSEAGKKSVRPHSTCVSGPERVGV